MSSSISINPLLFAQRQLLDAKGKVDPKEVSKFLGDLAQWANQIQQILVSPLLLASILNGNTNLFPSALIRVSSFSTIASGSTVTVSLANAIAVSLAYQFNAGIAATWTLNLTNVPLAIPVVIKFFNNTTAVTLKISGTDVNGTAFTAAAFLSGGTFVNMTTTGRSIGAGAVAMYVGALISGPELDLEAI